MRSQLAEVLVGGVGIEIAVIGFHSGIHRSKRPHFMAGIIGTAPGDQPAAFIEAPLSENIVSFPGKARRAPRRLGGRLRQRQRRRNDVYPQQQFFHHVADRQVVARDAVLGGDQIQRMTFGRAEQRASGQNGAKAQQPLPALQDAGVFFFDIGVEVRKEGVLLGFDTGDGIEIRHGFPGLFLRFNGTRQHFRRAVTPCAQLQRSNQRQ